ncbi:MAG: drug/metabolite transporter (DMT)-like permease [Oceanicoccus sp.]|jgi:drug/metabolite transporter (DMT)-like permease
MPLFAYLLTLVIWSTTPLAIKLSSDSVTPIAAISLRMLLALAIGALLLALMRRLTVFDKRNLKLYSVGSIGIFPTLVLIYYAAERIPSGLLAVVMGLSPFMTGLLAHVILKENFFTRRKLIAQLIAFSGLAFVFSGQLAMDAGGAIGILLVLCSAMLFSTSTVLVKLYSQHRIIAPLDQTLGAISFSLPGLLLSWWLLDGQTEITFSATSGWSIIYLAVVGSLVGFVLFYYVLSRMSVGLVALSLLITPVFALMLGQAVAGEVVTQSVLMGCGLILLGIAIYENLFVLPFKKRSG